VAALLDEVMGCAVLCSGQVVVSADLRVRYRKLLPLPQRCIADARVERVEGRKVWTSARLRDVSGETLFSESEGVFLGLGSGAEPPRAATDSPRLALWREIEEHRRDPS
jgi:acyl-coenzyme A thioesterase PaaI-like protein